MSLTNIPGGLRGQSLPSPVPGGRPQPADEGDGEDGEGVAELGALGDCVGTDVGELGCVTTDGASWMMTGAGALACVGSGWESGRSTVQATTCREAIAARAIEIWRTGQLLEKRLEEGTCNWLSNQEKNDAQAFRPPS
jgi:hypothetical protein